MKTLTPEQLNTILEDHRLWMEGKGCGKCANLSGANLSDADLSGAALIQADLRYADLYHANLYHANLRGAYLRGAYLRDADLCRANLCRADLSDADLRYADLYHANLYHANLRYALLRGAKLEGAYWGENIPVIENIHQKVYAAASKEGALDMGKWHNECGTTHCRAGWVVTLAGERGRELEKETSTGYAALAIYAASDPAYFTRDGIPDFFASNEDALADMKRLAELEASQ